MTGPPYKPEGCAVYTCLVNGRYSPEAINDSAVCCGGMNVALNSSDDSGLKALERST